MGEREKSNLSIPKIKYSVDDSDSEDSVKPNEDQIVVGKNNSANLEDAKEQQLQSQQEQERTFEIMNVDSPLKSHTKMLSRRVAVKRPGSRSTVKKNLSNRQAIQRKAIEINEKPNEVKGGFVTSIRDRHSSFPFLSPEEKVSVPRFSHSDFATGNFD